MSLFFSNRRSSPGNAGGLAAGSFGVIGLLRKNPTKERTGGEDRRRYQDPISPEIADLEKRATLYFSLPAF
jgi:hypothetical protein